MTLRIIVGDSRTELAALPEASVQSCVTSPPYYGLRNYGVAGQIGLEPSPDEYVAEMVAVFRGVRRVLRDDGTVWLNIGDSYAQGGSGGQSRASTLRGNGHGGGKPLSRHLQALESGDRVSRKPPAGYKPKDLLGIPWRVAFALQADGWFLRSAIVWAKPNPMPESVRDRPTGAYEMVFLLAKQDRYFYDADAIREENAPPTQNRFSRTRKNEARVDVSRHDKKGINGSGADYTKYSHCGRNARNVWTIAPKPFKGAHFATMPIDLAERCIKAGSKPGDTILDPFLGAGTTGLAAKQLGRKCVGIELNPDYARLARERVHGVDPLFSLLAAAE